MDFWKVKFYNYAGVGTSSKSLVNLIYKTDKYNVYFYLDKKCGECYVYYIEIFDFVDYIKIPAYIEYNHVKYKIGYIHASMSRFDVKYKIKTLHLDFNISGINWLRLFVDNIIVNDLSDYDGYVKFYKDYIVKNVYIKNKNILISINKNGYQIK